MNFLIPHLFNVESLQQEMKATIPPLTTEENTFFETSEIVKAYESDKNYQTTMCEPIEGEPGLLFHEFLILLGRIALKFVKTSETVSGRLEDFFVEKLNFRKQTETVQPTYDEVTKRL